MRFTREQMEAAIVQLSSDRDMDAAMETTICHGTTGPRTTEQEVVAAIKDLIPKPILGDRLLQYFAWAHLPDSLQNVSAPFGELARHLVHTLPASPERTVALRKLLESKDCAVRAALAKDEPPCR